MSAFITFALLVIVILLVYAALFSRLFQRGDKGGSQKSGSPDNHIFQIQNKILEESDRIEFPSETTVIYQLKLDRVESLIAQTLEFEKIELPLSDRQYYLVDSDPLGLFEKPIALVVFSNNTVETFIRLSTPLLVGEFLLPAMGFDPFYQEPLTNIGVATYALNFSDLFFQAGNQKERSGLTPFTYPRPTTGGTETPPISTETSGQPCTPAYVFVGLSLDGSTDGISAAGNQLNGQTKMLGVAFDARGYTSTTFMAGTDGANIDDLLTNLKNAIPTTFCNCPTDQLVILISAHGYGSQFNPTGKVAMRFQANNNTDSWVTHAQMAQKLGTILTNVPKNKVTILIYSCRSSVGFNKGNYNAHLGGSLLITSTDTNVLCYSSYANHLLMCLIDKKNKTWLDLLNCMKKKLKKEKKKNSNVPQPKGDILVTPPPPTPPGGSGTGSEN